MYNIIFLKPAEKFFRNLNKKDQEKIAKKIFALETNPKSGKPLVGKLSGLWSLRIGEYRAIYQIKNAELVVLVIKIGNRGNVYS